MTDDVLLARGSDEDRAKWKALQNDQYTGEVAKAPLFEKLRVAMRANSPKKSPSRTANKKAAKLRRKAKSQSGSSSDSAESVEEHVGKQSEEFTVQLSTSTTSNSLTQDTRASDEAGAKNRVKSDSESSQNSQIQKDQLKVQQVDQSTPDQSGDQRKQTSGDGVGRSSSDEQSDCSESQSQIPLLAGPKRIRNRPPQDQRNDDSDSASLNSEPELLNVRAQDTAGTQQSQTDEAAPDNREADRLALESFNPVIMATVISTMPVPTPRTPRPTLEQLNFDDDIEQVTIIDTKQQVELVAYGGPISTTNSTAQYPTIQPCRYG